MSARAAPPRAPKLEGFGIDPKDTRAMWQEAIEHVVGCWTNDEYEFAGEHWSMPKRRVLPKPLQQPHPPLWGATSSEDGHRQVGELGLGLCSFAVGVPPEPVKEKIDIYREAIGRCTSPIGRNVQDQASTFTMALCAPTREEAWDVARESFEWYPRAGARLIATVRPPSFGPSCVRALALARGLVWASDGCSETVVTGADRREAA
jgi:alkanesulfonate monooxygenase SsuD/methylene tetrahydromethanopterin reductase-like flavin-dependent oxidoreductase (luciferase family)